MNTIDFSKKIKHLLIPKLVCIGICFHWWNNSILTLLPFFSFQRVHLEILVGEHANDYAQIAAKDKLTELQLRMRQLLDQIDQITKEQAYQRVSFFTPPPT